jgi:hypothetical protein
VRGAHRIADDLHDSVAITQIQEDHAAMISIAINPATQLYPLLHEAGGNLTAVVSAHEQSPKSIVNLKAESADG